MAPLYGPRRGQTLGYMDWTNSLYATPDAMAKNAPAATANVPRDQFRWGEYHKRVAPNPGDWPHVPAAAGGSVHTFTTWDNHSAQVRASLARQANRQPVSPADPTVPPDRLGLLDEAVRTAFYSQPPIPKHIDVGTTDGPEHELELGWSQDGDGRLTRLHMLIRCPKAKAAG